jgi:NH3-dependent NAD+ synthetase
VTQHFEDIGHDISVHDVTYENAQARERTQILMDLANQVGALVIGTGDLSELALGWATYNGDHMSMYAVNASVPKTLIKYLVRFVAQTVDEQSAATLLDIIDTPISPELIPADRQGNITQKTEDLVGPYELHDFFLYYFLRHGFRPFKIYMLAQKAFGENRQGERRTGLNRCDHPALAQDLLLALLRPAVQAQLSARRPEGGFGEPQSAWRLAHAFRCRCRPVAAGGGGHRGPAGVGSLPRPLR